MTQGMPNGLPFPPSFQIKWKHTHLNRPGLCLLCISSFSFLNDYLYRYCNVLCCTGSYYLKSFKEEEGGRSGHVSEEKNGTVQYSSVTK